jgi:hypothetical protein
MISAISTLPGGSKKINLLGSGSSVRASASAHLTCQEVDEVSRGLEFGQLWRTDLSSLRGELANLVSQLPESNLKVLGLLLLGCNRPGQARRHGGAI